MGERRQQVVVEADAGRHVGAAGAVEIERDSRPSRAFGAEADPAGFVPEDVEAFRAASSCGNLLRMRARGSDQAIVLLCGADGETQATGQRVVRRERPRHEPRAKQSLGHERARSGVPKSTSMKLVTDGCGGQPISARARARRSRSDRRGRCCPRAPRDREGPGSRPSPRSCHGTRRPVELDPGQRRRRAMPNPTRNPASAYALHAVLTTTSWGTASAAAGRSRRRTRRTPRRRTAAGSRPARPHRRPAPSRRSRSGRLQQTGRVVRIAEPEHRRARHGRAEGCHIQLEPASGPSRGTGTTTPPRCSLTTRYIE